MWSLERTDYIRMGPVQGGWVCVCVCVCMREGERKGGKHFLKREVPFIIVYQGLVPYSRLTLGGAVRRGVQGCSQHELETLQAEVLASAHRRTGVQLASAGHWFFLPQGPKGDPHPGHTDPGMMTEETDLSPQGSSPLIMGQVARTVQEFTG